MSGRASCGCPIYTQRVCRGFDGSHRPIFDYHRQPFRCGCKHKSRPPGHYRADYDHDYDYDHKPQHYRKPKKPKKCK